MRRVLLVVSVTLAAAIFAAGALMALVLATGEPRPLTDAAARWAIERAAGAPVRIGHTEGSPLFGLELHEVVIAPGTPERFEIARLRIELDRISPTGSEIALRRLVIEGLRIDGRRMLDGRWRWAAGALELTPSTDRPAEPKADASTRVSIRDLRVENARLSLAFERASSTDDTLEARVDLRMRRMEWPLADDIHALPQTEIDVSEIRASAGGVGIERGALRLRLAGGPIELEANGVEGAWGRVPSAQAAFEVAGTTERPELVGASGRARFEALDPAVLAAAALPASDVSGEARFAWDGDRLSLEADVDASVAAGVALERGSARGALWRQAGELRFELTSAELEAEFGRLEASATGDAAGVEGGRLGVIVTDLAAWPEATRPAWLEAGSGTLDATWQGPWSSPSGHGVARLEAARVADVDVRAASMGAELFEGTRARVDALDVTLAAAAVERITAASPFSVDWGGEAVAIGRATLDLARSAQGSEPKRTSLGRVGIDGALSATRFDRLRLSVERLELAMLPIPAAPRFAPEGRLDGAIVITGPRSEPRLEGRLDWLAPSLGEIAAESVRLDLTRVAGDDAQHFVLVLAARGGVVADVRGRFSTRRLVDEPQQLLDDPKVELEAGLDDVDAAALARLAGVPEPAPSGRVDGRVRVRGPLRLPSIDAGLSGRSIDWQGLPPSDVSLSIDATDASGGALADLTVEESGRTPLALHVETDDRDRLASPRELLLAPGTHLALRLDRFDLAWLDAFTEPLGVRSSGEADGRLSIESGAVPDVEGSIAVEALALVGPGLPFDVGPMPARFDFAGRVARTTELTITSKRGDAGLRGQLSWHDPAEPVVQLTARATDFAIELPGVLDGRVDGDAVIEGPVMALEAQGGFLLHHARIDLPDAQDPIMREIRIQQLPAASAETSLREERRAGVYDAAAGEVALDVGESVWLRGLGAELELAGGLVARKRAGEPAALFGTVEVASGRVDFQGRWLRITSGSAIFDGAVDPDPFVDATAMHRTEEVTIYVRLRGRASSLKLELESEPPLPVEDQLSYLLFDRPAAEISASEQQSLSSAAMAASELVLGRFGNELGREVGLDRVRLGVDEEETPYVEVEKRVHERVAVRYGRSFGVDGGDHFVIEWRLFRELFLSGEQTTSGESGIDVFWRRDY